MHILITGANGQLGSEIRALKDEYPLMEFEFTDVGELDITDPVAIEHMLSSDSFDAIVNCAAYTAVDKAESDREVASRINALAPKLMAEAARKHGLALVHVSTDYVFDGTAYMPYTEELVPCPNSVYGETKRDGELAIQKACDDYVIIRTSWLYSEYGNNFVKTMLRLGAERDELGVIFDQIGTPTYAGDLAKAILDILAKKEAGEVKDVSGIYHYSNEGVCSWHDFATEIFRQQGMACRVKPIETVEYPTPAKRPHYSVMNKKKIKGTFGIEIQHWTEALSECLKRLTAEN